MKDTPKSAKRTETFSAEERAAIKDRAKEQKAAALEADGEAEVLAKIEEMATSDRAMAKRLHALVKAAVPALTPGLWYGMPAYRKGGKIICFFQPAQKFKTRYSTLGFNEDANLDEGTMWPVAYALMELTKADEARITALVKQAAS